MRRISLSILAAFCLCISSAAHSEGYILGSFGSAEDEVFDETAGAFKASVGSMLNENLGVEVGFVYLGSFDIAFLEVSQFGLAGSVNPTIPLGDSSSLFLKLGFFSWSFTVDDGFTTFEDDGVDPFVGFGLSLDLSDQAQLVLEYEAFEVADGDVNLVSAGVRILF